MVNWHELAGLHGFFEPGCDFSTEDLAVPSEELFVSDSAVDPVTTLFSSWIIIFHHFSSFFVIFHHFPSFFIIFHHLSSFFIIFHHLIISRILKYLSILIHFLGPEKHAPRAPLGVRPTENFGSSAKISSNISP